MKAAGLVATAAVGLLFSLPAHAAQYVYPSQGQDKARQASDEAECSAWAKQQTGFDPAKAAAAGRGAPTGSATDTSALTSALGAIPGGGGMGVPGVGGGGLPGGIPGVGGGGIPGVGGMGGAAGMLGSVGGQSGGASQALGMVNQAIGKHPQQQQSSPGLADYDRARAACLTGRGYSVQ
jgi:hypothetical protein